MNCTRETHLSTSKDGHLVLKVGKESIPFDSSDSLVLWLIEIVDKVEALDPRFAAKITPSFDHENASAACQQLPSTAESIAG